MIKLFIVLNRNYPPRELSPAEVAVMLLILSPFIYYFGSIPVSIIQHYKAREIHLSKIFLYRKPLSYERTKIVEDKIPYYKKLSREDQAVFRKNIQHFLINKKFTSEDGMEVTEEMKVMLAATAIQIMFGIEAYYLSHFHTICLTRNTDTSLKVLHTSRTISVSWNDFKKGYTDSDDGYNPGLKIMAMALSLEQRLNKHSESMFNRNTLKTFNQVYKQQAERYIQSGKSTYNSYSEVDRSEYFAVAVEYFFERPHDFKEKRPEMYLALAKLLRQDPTGYLIYRRR